MGNANTIETNRRIPMELKGNANKMNIKIKGKENTVCKGDTNKCTWNDNTNENKQQQMI